MYVNGSAYTTAYAYAPGAESGQTTALVQEITQPGENHSYAYDNVGNIVSAARNGVTITYAYDALGQLIRVNDPNDGTWTYEYDCGGNILSKKKYAYTTGTPGTVQQIVSYAYGDADWKDKLTRFNGVDIAYDAIGNPIQDGVWTYTWENGRQLRRMACDATIAEFVYNADGLRVQKTVNGVTTNYTLHGKNIVHMTKGNAELHFWYDAQNRPALVEFNGTKYGYLYNLQGDVIGLIDSANTEVVKYTYDAWGKPLSVTGSLANTIGYYNPFRYRGYVYDVETGLYYLRSRYYNPSWGRFVNADNQLDARVTIKAQNIFSYCANLPVLLVDENGHRWDFWDKVIDYLANIGRGFTDVARSFEVSASINVGLAAEGSMTLWNVPFTGDIGGSADIINIKIRDGKIEYGGGYSAGIGFAPAKGMGRYINTHVGVDCWHPYEFDESECTCGLDFDKMPYCPLTEGGIGVASSVSDTKASKKLELGGGITAGIGGAFYMGVDVEQLWNSLINLGGAFLGCPIDY